MCIFTMFSPPTGDMLQTVELESVYSIVVPPSVVVVEHTRTFSILIIF